MQTRLIRSPSVVQDVASRHRFEIKSAPNFDAFWRANIRVLDSVIPHLSCSLMTAIVDWRPNDGRHQLRTQEDGSRPLANPSVSSPFLAAHPQVKLYTSTEMVREDPTAALRGRERENEFSGWCQFAHLAFWDSSRLDAILSVRRSVDQGEFTADEKMFLLRLHLIIDTDLRRLRAFERERRRSAEMEHFISGLPMPVMLLDSNGELVFATPEAYDVCAAWHHGFKVARSMNTRKCFRLPPEIAAAAARLQEQWNGAIAGGEVPPSRRERVIHPEMTRLTASLSLVQPLRGQSAKPGYWVSFTSDQNIDGANTELRSEAMARLLQLTPSERRVALLVAEGCHNIEVARRLVKSPRTIEFQLNMIYKKLAVSGRTELAHVLS